MKGALSPFLPPASRKTKHKIIKKNTNSSRGIHASFWPGEGSPNHPTLGGLMSVRTKLPYLHKCIIRMLWQCKKVPRFPFLPLTLVYSSSLGRNRVALRAESRVLARSACPSNAAALIADVKAASDIFWPFFCISRAVCSATHDGGKNTFRKNAVARLCSPPVELWEC